MPTSNNISTSTGGYRTKVDIIESKKGYHLNSNASSGIQIVLEAKTEKDLPC